MFDHILTLDKHLRCDFYISVEDMLEDEVDCLIDGFSVSIEQGSDVLFIERCDKLLS